MLSVEILRGLAEDERFELPQGCPRRFSRPLQYRYANPPVCFLLDYKITTF